jgi:hypothetical protein
LSGGQPDRLRQHVRGLAEALPLPLLTDDSKFSSCQVSADRPTWTNLVTGIRSTWLGGLRADAQPPSVAG